MLALFLSGCKNSSDNNHGLDYAVLDVNFEGTLSGRSWSEGDRIGIFASCTRHDEQDVRMSSNANALYTVSGGETSRLTKATDSDAVIAESSDHNIRFHAYYPYSGSVTGAAALPVGVPAVQSYAAGVMSYGVYVASRGATTVVPTIDLEFKGVFSAIDLYLPDDIVDEDGGSVIRKLTLAPAVPANFSGVLADKGTYDFETGTFTSDNSARSGKVEIDFGSQGLLLTGASTLVSLAVTPFTVPEGGMSVVFTDVDGYETTVPVLSKAEDAGTVLAAGETLALHMSTVDDGVIPVTFPVTFPLNTFTGAAGTGNFTAVYYPEWPSNGTNTGTGYWKCISQPQAYGQWTRASSYWTDNPTPVPFTETINSGVLISTPGIKGIWTGDYLEFVIPVRKFAAGSALTMKFPLHSRWGPIFWNIEYLDGEVWKCNKTPIDFNGTTREATCTVNPALYNVGHVIEHTMTYTNAVKSGYLKIRLKCVDGSLCTEDDGGATKPPKVVTVTTPHKSATAYDATFYFYAVGSNVNALTFSVN